MEGVTLTSRATVVVSSALVVVLAGCGTSAYQIKAHPTAPVSRPEVKAEAGGVELQVSALIVYEGPGAWKRRAYWDEYLVTFTNRGGNIATVVDASLGDVLDRAVAPGANPWALEKAGRKHEQYLRSLGAPADASYSAMTRNKRAMAGAAGVGGVALIYGGVGAAAVGPALIYAAPFVLLAAAPVLAVNHFFVDPKNKELVVAEFNRRRLKLPIELPPGGAISGSLFFPLTPGPEQLIAMIDSGGNASVLLVVLPGLEELHFTYIPDKAILKSAKSQRFFIKPAPERKTEPKHP